MPLSKYWLWSFTLTIQLKKKITNTILILRAFQEKNDISNKKCSNTLIDCLPWTAGQRDLLQYMTMLRNKLQHFCVHPVQALTFNTLLTDDLYIKISLWWTIIFLMIYFTLTNYHINVPFLVFNKWKIYVIIHKSIKPAT